MITTEELRETIIDGLCECFKDAGFRSEFNTQTCLVDSKKEIRVGASFDELAYNRPRYAIGIYKKSSTHFEFKIEYCIGFQVESVLFKTFFSSQELYDRNKCDFAKTALSVVQAYEKFIDTVNNLIWPSHRIDNEN